MRHEVGAYVQSPKIDSLLYWHYHILIYSIVHRCMGNFHPRVNPKKGLVWVTIHLHTELGLLAYIENSFSLLYYTWIPNNQKMLRQRVIFTTTLSTLLLGARIKVVVVVPLISSTNPLLEKKIILHKDGKSYSHNPKTLFPDKSYITSDHGEKPIISSPPWSFC